MDDHLWLFPVSLTFISKFRTKKGGIRWRHHIYIQTSVDMCNPTIKLLPHIAILGLVAGSSVLDVSQLAS